MNVKKFPYKNIRVLKNLQKSFRRFLKREKIRLIHARFGTTGVKLLSTKQSLRVPMITSFHGYDVPSNRRKDPAYYKSIKKLFKIGEHFTVTSQYMKRQLIRLGCPKRKITVLRSGIDLNKFRYRQPVPPKPGEKTRILSVGRLVRKKGMDDLLKAFRKVSKKHKVGLVIIGDGSEKNKLKKLAKKLKIKHNVSLKGEASHRKVLMEMKRAHLFCLASRTDKKGDKEGIPNVLKEAMAIGLPVISTKHAGIPELIDNNRSGYLVEERNHRKLAKKK